VSVTTTQAQIERLVQAFYADVIDDDLLGPVFRPVVGEHWPAHLSRMVEFWCTVLLRTRSFRGNVLKKHMDLLPRIEPGHFARWLSLWNHHTAQIIAPDDAAELQTTAAGIARNLHLGCFASVPRFERHGACVQLVTR
jgi:hemoglobin